MPPLDTFLTAFLVDPVALVVLLATGILYGLGVHKTRHQSMQWPVRRTVAFYLLGLGSYAWVSFGFLGVFSPDLRWAFATRVAMLVLVVPALVSMGRPLLLARQTLSVIGGARLRAVLDSRLIRFSGNAIFEPLFGLALFALFLTRIAGEVRTNQAAEWAISLVIPLLGLITIVPIIENTAQRTSFFITIEFVLAFFALAFDPIPGILLRLSEKVVDPSSPVTTIASWMPSALRDQQLSGDLLWFIAELIDVPILIILIIRWNRIERRETVCVDELSDEEFDALAEAHLRGLGRT